MSTSNFISTSLELDRAGLVWLPEIGDEVSPRPELNRVSILVDPQGMPVTELRDTFLWLPTVEQLVMQIEARQAFLYHAGITDSLGYEAVIRFGAGVIEVAAESLRLALANALKELLVEKEATPLH